MTNRSLGAALLLAVTALLLTTRRGRFLRTRWGERAGGLLGGQLGRLLGQQLGGHPLRTARIARRARRLMGVRSA